MVDKGKGFQIFAHILLSFLIICAIAPFILLIMSSITEEQTLITNGYSFFPEKFSTYAYEYLFTKSAAVFRGYAISFLVTAIGTVCNLLFTTLYAYPLSRKELPGRNIFAFYLFFTMLFSGGLVPSYLMWTQTFHIRNTVFALLIPNLLMSAFNVIMMRTYFSANIPDAVIEAARVDGANEFKILFGIVLPMALPIIATIGLLVGLAYWNDWYMCMLFIDKKELFDLQYLLYQLMGSIKALREIASQSTISVSSMPIESTKMALTIVATGPIILVYPFVQKYFVKGLTLGSVKG